MDKLIDELVVALGNINGRIVDVREDEYGICLTIRVSRRDYARLDSKLYELLKKYGGELEYEISDDYKYFVIDISRVLGESLGERITRDDIEYMI